MIKRFCIAFAILFLFVSPLTVYADVVYGNEFFYFYEFPALFAIFVLVFVLVAVTAVLIKMFWRPKSNKVGGKKQ